METFLSFAANYLIHESEEYDNTKTTTEDTDPNALESVLQMIRMAWETYNDQNQGHQ